MLISIILNIILVITIVIIAIKWPKTVVIEDSLPEKDTPKNRWMKLQNEGSSHVKERDGKLYIKVVE